MEKYNDSITESLAYVFQSVQDIPFDDDLCHLKSSLRHVMVQVDRAFNLVNTELDSTRRNRRERNRNSTL